MASLTNKDGVEDPDSQETWKTDISEQAAELRAGVEVRQAPFRAAHHRDDTGQMAEGVYSSNRVKLETEAPPPAPPRAFQVGDHVTVDGGKEWAGYEYVIDSFIKGSPTKAALRDRAEAEGSEPSAEVAVTKLKLMPAEEPPVIDFANLTIAANEVIRQPPLLCCAQSHADSTTMLTTIRTFRPVRVS